MCGIVGYVGGERCIEVLINGLKHLEYRGYDSAGIALQHPQGIECIKAVGPLKNLAAVLEEKNGYFLGVRSGIGHTRWATHGRPSEANAHPHLDNAGSVAVVHNGIVENFADLREELEGRGHRFNSETDTEVIAHLLGERVAAGETLTDALVATLERLEGSFALAVASDREPEKLVAARKQSPLVVGLGDGENFLASAVQALLGYTRKFLVVENGEVAILTGDSVEVRSLLDEEPVERKLLEVAWSADATQLGGFEDYMLKEIHEQPAATRTTLADYLDPNGRVELPGLNLAGINHVTIVACGTAYHAGLLGRYAIERLARIPVEVAVASEYRYANPLGDGRTLAIAVSQSGETTDTLAALEVARSFGGRILAVTNTQGSLITREAEEVLLTKAGPEVGVAATKTFLAQICALYLLALKLAGLRGGVPEDELRKLGRELRRVPEKLEAALGLLGGRVDEAARIFDGARCSLFIGRGVAYPVALEGALKLKEISYVPAEGHPAGEMKHGPIALVDENCPVVAVLGQRTLREKTISNVEETVARGALVVAVANEGDTVAERLPCVLLPVPELPEMLSPLVSSVALQLLAYHVAKGRGLDVDKPRNLAKSVTVE